MVQVSKWFDKMFPIVEASKLSLEDEFLKYEPEEGYQKWIKETLMVGIKAGLKDFRKPRMSLLSDEFAYEVGLSPVKGRTCGLWRANAKSFMPEKNSRLGTETEYAAFLGLAIKFFINEMEYTVSEAWNTVCNFHTREVVKYLNSRVARRSELTRKDLRQENILFMSPSGNGDSFGDAYYIKLYQQAGYQPNIILRSNDMESILMMVAAEEGISIVPEYTHPWDVGTENVVFVPLAGEGENEEILIAWRKNDDHQVLRHFLQKLPTT